MPPFAVGTEARELGVECLQHDDCAQELHWPNAEAIALHDVGCVGLVEVPDGEQCCGSAGIYNLVEPGSADEIGRRKAEAVLSTKATLVASANPGCSLQIRRMLEERGAAIEAAHPIEILDRALRGER